MQVNTLSLIPSTDGSNRSPSPGELAPLLAAPNEMREIFETKFELTPMQQAMLFHCLYASHPGLYVEQVGCRIHGPLEAPVFERAWQMVVARHQILRASFEWQGVE